VHRLALSARPAARPRHLEVGERGNIRRRFRYTADRLLRPGCTDLALAKAEAVSTATTALGTALSLFAAARDNRFAAKGGS
jgi:hypothetical protein